MSLSERIKHLHPCSDAMDWLAQQKTPAQAWRDCQRGDWMLWLLGRLNDSPPWSDGRKPLLACCLDCAETVKHLWPEASKDKIAASVAVLRRWIAGEATVDQAKAARRILYAAAYAAADAAAAADDDADAAAYAAYADAAYAAAYAAYAADADADAYADAAADAAYAAYAAADADADARTKKRAECAGIVRLPQHFPMPPKVSKPKPRGSIQ